MRRFRCTCGQPLFFDNFVCERCSRPVGFAPDQGRMIALSSESATDDTLAAADPGLTASYRFCGNSEAHAVCNWLIPADQPVDLCASCLLNRVVPDLSRAENAERWLRLEGAKRRLLYSLYDLQLPVIGKGDDPVNGLTFDFMEDQRSNPAVPETFVATGHADGVITINVIEADSHEQVRTRERLNEQYRTLLGHMRHESGHYYWDRLIRDGDRLNAFRRLFGDETVDYTEAMNSYYQNGALADWNQSFISPYASSHPWEDWAESWAHYLHMVDTLETARSYQILDEEGSDRQADDFDRSVKEWLRLTVILNELNRSMGQDDSYPFVVPPGVIEKLRFVHDVVRSNGRSNVGLATG